MCMFSAEKREPLLELHFRNYSVTIQRVSSIFKKGYVGFVLKHHVPKYTLNIQHFLVIL